jgi:competence protein ComEC
MPRVYILDVGHGNSTVLVDTAGVLVVDAGSSSALLSFLQEKEIQKIDVLLISHADGDHISGLIGILSEDIEIARIYLNPDRRDTEIWKDLITVLKDSKDRGLLGQWNVGLTSELTGNINQGDITVEVLAPTPQLATVGSGGNDLRGRRITPHSMSAVIRLKKDGLPCILLPGDIDEIGLANLWEEAGDKNARLLVFPHHGGNLGLNNDTLTENLCRNVNPEIIIFSIGRGNYNTPLPGILAKIREILPNVSIACTQISKSCTLNLPGQQRRYLAPDFARGRETNACCVGTIVIDFEPIFTLRPVLMDHQAYITAEIPTALCLRGIRG